MVMIRRSLRLNHLVAAPASLAITSFVAIEQIGKTWTPALMQDGGSVLIFVHLPLYSNRLELMLLM